MEKKKVLFYLERWSSGGIEALISGIIMTDSFSERATAHVVAHKIEDSIFTERLLERGVVFHELSGRIRNRKNAVLFKKLLSENSFDAVHFNIFHGLSFRLFKIAKRCGVKVRIAHSHGAGLRKSTSRPLKLAVSKIGCALWGSYSTARVAPSREAAEFLFGSKDAMIIGNGIDVSRFSFSEVARMRIRSALSLCDSFVIGHVGRFSEEKNHAFLLNILEGILKRGVNAHLLLAGDGPLFTEIQEKSKNMGLSERITFLGAVTNTEDYLSAMDVFLLPSTSEGFGIAAIEAQASGLPTVVSDRVPKAVLVSDSYTVLPLDSQLSWVDACIGYMGMPRNAGRAAEAIRARGYDIDSTAAKILSLYESES